MIKTKREVVHYDSAENRFNSRLQALVSEQKIAVRGFVQQGYNGLPLKNGSLTTQDAVNIILERSEDLVNAVRKYNKLIRVERTKANPAVHEGRILVT